MALRKMFFSAMDEMPFDRAKETLFNKASKEKFKLIGLGQMPHKSQVTSHNPNPPNTFFTSPKMPHKSQLYCH